MRVGFVPPMTRKLGCTSRARLKQNYFRAILKALKPFREPNFPDTQAPVRAAYRYFYNRPQHLDYKATIAAELPIGSGEIESAHR
jgi:hypothetical protein